MSPSQRETLGDELPRPAERSESYRACSVLSIPRSPPLSWMPVPPVLSSTCPPSTSRQRRRRSFSSVSIEVHLQNPCQHRQDGIRSLLVDSNLGSCRAIFPCGRYGAQVLRLLAHLAPLWLLETGEGASQERQQPNEILW